MRKWPAIDLIKLYTTTDTQTWNVFLTQCLKHHDIDRLCVTYYGLQAGMADLAKAKLNDEKMIQFFIRLQRSIEITVKRIFRIKYPNPHDDPLYKSHDNRWLEVKRKRDYEFSLFMQRARY